MNETKIAQLKQQVSTSRVLSEQERQEWLLMLPLMNDKQMADLETILHSPASNPAQAAAEQSSPKPASAPLTQMQSRPPVESLAPQPQVSSSFMPPKLTHIANIPAGVVSNASHQQTSNNNNGSTRSAVIPQSPSAHPNTKAAWDEELKRELAEHELPAPKQNLPRPAVQPKPQPSSPSLSQMSPLVSKIVPPPPLPPKPPAPLNASAAPAAPSVKSDARPAVRHDDFWSALLEPKRAQVSVDVAAAAAEGREPAGPVITAIQSLADVSLLSLESLKQLTPKTVIASLQKMVHDEGYEYVVAAFEKSALYRIYLTAGSLALQKNMTFEQLSVSKAAEELPITRMEFEMIADVLKNMQVN